MFYILYPDGLGKQGRATSEFFNGPPHQLICGRPQLVLPCHAAGRFTFPSRATCMLGSILFAAVALNNCANIP